MLCRKSLSILARSRILDLLFLCNKGLSSVLRERLIMRVAFRQREFAFAVGSWQRPCKYLWRCLVRAHLHIRSPIFSRPPISDSGKSKPDLTTWGTGGVETISYYRMRTLLGGRTSWGTGSVVLNGECSFLIPHLRMGCREETWVMVNTFIIRLIKLGGRSNPY
jgi:hypothetical protein